MNPIVPDNSLLHCIVLLPAWKDYIQPLLKRLPIRLPGIDTTQKNWTAVTTPRPCLYGPYSWNEWKWHLLIGMTALPEDIRQIVDLARTEEITTQAIREHKMYVMVFLVGAPDGIEPMEQMRALCQIAWTLLDVGASVVVWPAGRSAWHCNRLIDIAPSSLSAQHAHLFVSYDVAGHADDRLWVRTFGMSQFALPDMACIVANTSENLEAVDVLFNSMPFHIIQRQEPLPLGDTLEIEHKKWKVIESGISDIPCLNSEFGIQVFSRADSEKKAREFAASLLWEPTFPGKPVPEVESISRRVISLIVVLVVVVLALPMLFAFLGWWGPIFRLLGG
jgi:hypothetical protein